MDSNILIWESEEESRARNYEIAALDGGFEYFMDVAGRCRNVWIKTHASDQDLQIEFCELYFCSTMTKTVFAGILGIV